MECRILPELTNPPEPPSANTANVKTLAEEIAEQGLVDNLKALFQGIASPLKGILEGFLGGLVEHLHL